MRRRRNAPFWESTVAMPNGCIEWTGARQISGHGRAVLNGRVDGAHRVAWQFTNGPIPVGMVVCHSCDNPPCVNPAHLWLGTQKDNMQDAAAKGRLSGRPYPVYHGSESPVAKLNEEQVLEIRRRRAAGERGRALAAEFGVTESLICGIHKGRFWTWL